MSDLRERVAAMLRNVRLPRQYVPHQPTPRQLAALSMPVKELFYGGAAGGGKSDWLLMEALQYVHIPGYSAILFRRTSPQLHAAGGLIPRSKEWLGGTDAEWSAQHSRWTFPSGATLAFGHMQLEDDKFSHQGPEYQFVGFDELTHFSESQYRYLFSRLRRLEGSSIPLRMRGASNPGGKGHEWVKQRFVASDDRRRIFIPSKLADNPYLDQAEYLSSLAELDPVTRKQLLDGDWDVRPAGGLFKREWFEIVDQAPTDAASSVRFWDLAATEAKAGNDPDWTVGTRLVKKGSTFFVAGVDRFRGSPQTVKARILANAQADGRRCDIVIEQEPGSSGKMAIADLVSSLAGYTARGKRATGSKLERARPFSSQCEAGNVKLVRGPWLQQWFDELEAFPAVSHDDQVDSASGAFGELSTGWGWGALYGSEAQSDAA